MNTLANWATRVFGQYGAVGLFVIAFAESSFFPVPPDVLLVPLCVARQASALWYAALTTIASVLGAVFAYLVGARGGRPLLRRYANPDTITEIERLFSRHGGWAVGIAAFTPIPFKVFTIAAGIFRVRPTPFVVASTIGRGARFFLEAALVMAMGERARDVLGTRFELITLIAALVLSVAAVIIARLQRNRRTRPADAPAATGAATPAALAKVRIAGAAYIDRLKAARSEELDSLREFFSPRKRLSSELAIYGMAGFVFLVILLEEVHDLVESGRAAAIWRLDAQIVHVVQAARSPALTRLAEPLAALGSYPLIFAGLGLAVALLMMHGRRTRSAAITVCVVGALVLSMITPFVFNLEPPEEPAGHVPAMSVLVSVCFYGMLAHVLRRRGYRNGAVHRLTRAATSGPRSVWPSVAVCVILAISASAVYLGVQWPSEVAVSLLAGVAWLTICIWLLAMAEQGRTH